LVTSVGLLGELSVTDNCPVATPTVLGVQVTFT
jgi:hypothetical protein